MQVFWHCFLLGRMMLQLRNYWRRLDWNRQKPPASKTKGLNTAESRKQGEHPARWFLKNCVRSSRILEHPARHQSQNDGGRKTLIYILVGDPSDLSRMKNPDACVVKPVSSKGIGIDGIDPRLCCEWMHVNTGQSL